MNTTLRFDAYTLSESYRLKGDKEKEKEYLIVSAMADMKTAVREYISLRKLAVLLYQEGDIERAYSYVKICMEDAAACNARLRKLRFWKSFPSLMMLTSKRRRSSRSR